MSGVNIIHRPPQFYRTLPALAKKFTHLGFGGNFVLANEAEKEACVTPSETDSEPFMFREVAFPLFEDVSHFTDTIRSLLHISLANQEISKVVTKSGNSLKTL
jgi:hypothetical protein